MPATALFTPREVAKLSATPKRVIEKAIEERVLVPRYRRAGERGGEARRMLPAHAVAYATLIAKIDLKLSKAQKQRLADRLAGLPASEFRVARVEVAPAVTVEIGRLLGDVMERSERYRSLRDAHIVSDPAIKGGAPVIRGTRVGVHSLLGRIEHGESFEDILEDNPDLSREAVEVALSYARSHPPLGRPGDRPWRRR